MEKNKSVIFLIVWFIWAAGKCLDSIVRYSVTSDYYIFSAMDMSPIYFIFVFSIFSLNTATVFYLFRPTLVGIYVAITALIVAFIQNMVSMSLALKDLEGVKEAYAIGRVARGLSVRDGALDMIFSQNGIITASAIMTVFYFLVAYVVVRNKSYFGYVRS